MNALRCQHRSLSIQCEADAAWLVFAAHSVEGDRSARGLAVIDPQPIVPTCSEHLHAVMLDDEIPTREWLVRPVGWGAS